MKPIYFLSDAHLGSRAIAHSRTQERRLVSFLDSVKEKAGAIYLLGDMFDFWYEYRTVVPRGYTRFLGKLSELSDRGIEIHYFTGNHDIWCYSYLQQECGVTVHHEPLTVELGDKVFFLAHGDGIGREKRTFRLIQSIFHNRVCQWLFSAIHPDCGVEFGLRWAEKSRSKHDRQGGEPPYKGEAGEPLVVFAKEYLATHSNVNYFIFGHRHIELELMLSHSAHLFIIGDWISKFTYAVFDGSQLWMENYVEGDSEP